MALELNGTSGIQFNDGSDQSTAATPYGRKNLIINGDMNIAQRGTSTTSVTTTGYNSCDRWKNVLNTLGTFTVSQDTNTPSGQGFAKSLKMDCTTADASPASTDYNAIIQVIEGQNLQHLKKGTSSAESLSLSFWVKSNKTGTYTCEFRDADNTRSISQTYTISSADTWEKKTITVDGDTTGAFDNDNAGSFQLWFWLGAGSDYTSGTLNTSWNTSTTNERVSSSQVNLADSTSNYINITGCQLEIGDSASDFEFMPYDMELHRCQRYYIKYGGLIYSQMAMGIAQSTTRAYYNVPLSVQMRATPSIGFSTLQTHDANTAYSITGLGPAGNETNSFNAYIYGDVASGLTAYRPYMLRAGGSASGYLEMIAEL